MRFPDRVCRKQIKCFCFNNKLHPDWEEYFFDVIEVRPGQKNHELARVALMNHYQFSYMLPVNTPASWFHRAVLDELFEELEQQTITPEYAEVLFARGE